MATVPSKQFRDAYDRLMSGSDVVNFGRAWCMTSLNGKSIDLYHYDTLIARFDPDKKFPCILYDGFSASDRDGINSLACIVPYIGRCVCSLHYGEITPDHQYSENATTVYA